MSDPDGRVGQGGVASCQKFDGFTGGEYTGAVGKHALQLFSRDGQGEATRRVAFDVDAPEGDQLAVGGGMAVSAVGYLTALWIRSASGKGKKWALTLGLIAVLGCLAFFKYTDDALIGK